ncbi:MAG: proton-conducting transporter membrane subunit [Bryobacteraceae bacterium]
MILDTLALTSMALYVFLAIITLASMPKRDREPGRFASLGCIVGGTLLAYAAPNLPVFAAGWTLTVVPYWIWMKTGPKLALTAGTLVLFAGVGLISAGGDSSMRMLAFGVLTLAVLFRKGIFPLHSWVVSGLDSSPMLPLGLLFNGHLGAYLMVRFAIPLLPDAATQALTLLSVLALFTALYAALVALSETRPRRILGFLTVSQASFLLAGLESRNTEGVTGALVHWFVVVVATTGLYCVYRGLEARYPAVASPAGFLGLMNVAPRMAVFFALSGLALVGLPGTLGFAAEDLLLHGSLESHPWLGLTLPLATAFNAITVYRLFSTLFMGRAASATPTMPDAMPRERWALTAVAMFLVVNGILPSMLVSLRSQTAEHIAAMLSGR